MTSTPLAGALQRYRNARILLFSNQLPGVLDSPRTGRFLFEGFIKRLRQISSRDNSPGVDTGDLSYKGCLTRGSLLPLLPSGPWDWLSVSIPWSTSGTRPLLANGSTLLAPCSGVVWLGNLADLSSPGVLPPANRAQFAAFSVTEFGGLYGPGGIGSLTQPLLGERIEASLKPNCVVVIAAGDTLNVLAERHGSTVTTLRTLNPELSFRPSAPLPVGSWLFLPRRCSPANASETPALPAGFHTPETLAIYLGVSTATIESWNANGYGPPFVKLGDLVHYTYLEGCPDGQR